MAGYFKHINELCVPVVVQKFLISWRTISLPAKALFRRVYYLLIECCVFSACVLSKNSSLYTNGMSPNFKDLIVKFFLMRVYIRYIYLWDPKWFPPAQPKPFSWTSFQNTLIQFTKWLLWILFGYMSIIYAYLTKRASPLQFYILRILFSPVRATHLANYIFFLSRLKV